ncbi:MAG: hypothetical protein ACYCQJ_04715 [Nitrososphaerales archaeon]
MVRNSNASSAGSNKLSQVVSLNSYGQILVNETVTVSSSSISSVVFGFPGNYTNHLVAESASYSIGSSTYKPSVSNTEKNGTLLVSLSLPTAFSGSSSGSISLGFYVIGSDAVNTSTTSDYLVPIVFYPSLNLPLGQLNSTIEFAFPTTAPSTAATAKAGTEGFASTTTSNLQEWTLETTNVTNPLTLHSATVDVTSSSSDSGLIDFQSIQRTISASSGGQPLVTDSFTIFNSGQNSLTNIAFSVLTNSSTVNVEPSSEPPLSNLASTTIANGEIDLSGIGETVEPNSAVTVVIQYPLGQQYWSYSNGVYNLHIPETLPVKALVDHFSINFDLPSSSRTGSVVLAETAGVNSTLSLTYNQGIGSAYTSIVPIAIILFVATLIAALVFRPRKESDEEIETTFDTLLRSIEDKVAGTNDILTELKSKGASVTRTDLSTARIRIEDLRTKSSGRFGSIRSDLGSSGSSAQAALGQVAVDDREFDRAVKDMLNTYDQFISKKMKQDSFSRAQQNTERRIQRIANNLLDALQDLRRDYEQEQ